MNLDASAYRSECLDLLGADARGTVYAIVEGGRLVGAVAVALCRSPRTLWLCGIATKRDGFRPAKQRAIRDLILDLAKSRGCLSASGRVIRPGLSRLYDRWGARVSGSTMDGKPIYTLEVPHGR